MAYLDDVAASEGQRQVDHSNAVDDAGHRAADEAHYTRLLAASILWGVSNGSYGALLTIATKPAGDSEADLGGGTSAPNVT
jgi:hypothetical protein